MISNHKNSFRKTNGVGLGAVHKNSNKINNNNPNEKLLDLKSKIQSEKQMMRQSGKRFKECEKNEKQKISKERQITKSIQIKNRKQIEKKQISKSHKTKDSSINMSMNTQEVVKQTINLMEISTVINEPSNNKNTSKVLSRQIKLQKNRNQQMLNFLISLHLEGYEKQLIELGHEQMQTLVDVTTEELNCVMMRAHQQDKLIQALHQYRIKKGIQQDIIKPSILVDKPSFIPKHKTKIIHQYQLPKSYLERKFNASSSSKSSNKSLFTNNSILYEMGAKQWFSQDQIRRACCICYKVSKQLRKIDECYYCSLCYLLQPDQEMTINNSMIVKYHD